MNPLRFRTSIYFSRKSRSREDLKKLDAFCKNEKTVKKAYLGFSGRTFFFGFSDAKTLDAFKEEMKALFEKKGIEFVFNPTTNDS